MPEKYLNLRTITFLESQLSGKERVLIKGASGWVGRTATLMLHQLDVPILLFGSYSRKEVFGSSEFSIQAWNEEVAMKFNPTHMIDAAYLTREFTLNHTAEEYLRINKHLVNQTVELTARSPGLKLITFSSGVTEIEREQGKPYTVAKKNDEIIFRKAAESYDNQTSMFRIWSITGGLVTKKHGFAFSDLILQAKKGQMQVNASSSVMRRYCLVDEVIALGFTKFAERFRIVDTGGELIEIRDLAKKILKIVNPLATLEFADHDSQLESDNYFSDGIDWNKLSNQNSYLSASINDQINLVSNSLNT